jgi:hypothetical protein
MRPLTDAELLAAWERGRGCGPDQCALVLLAAACPDLPAAELARLPVGRRDALLLTLREWTFGPRVEALVGCPACGLALEVSCDAADLRASEPPAGGGELFVEAEGLRARVRLPDSLDLLHAAAAGSPEGARRVLGERCLEWPDGVPAAGAPEAALGAAAAVIAAADPQAAVTLDVDCPGCGAAVSTAWDVAPFFWAELHAWALRVLREVHTLAAAYGWTEATTLNLSAHRRRLYLQMVSG